MTISINDNPALQFPSALQSFLPSFKVIVYTFALTKPSFRSAAELLEQKSSSDKHSVGCLQHYRSDTHTQLKGSQTTSSCNKSTPFSGNRAKEIGLLDFQKLPKNMTK